MNTPVISLQNVCKRFGKTKALDYVNLEIPQGVVFALLGENGAGKTTLIRILTGFLKPDEGQASVLGQSCDQGGDGDSSPDWLRIGRTGVVRVDDIGRNRLVHISLLRRSVSRSIPRVAGRL